MSEKIIVNNIMKYLREINCFCFKEHGGIYGTSGIPDIICCCNGRFVALEVKTATGKASKLQQWTIGKIKAAGGVSAVVRSVDEVKELMEVLLNES